MQLGVGGSDTGNQIKNQIFPNSPFCATTVNLGPRSATKPHRDSKNLVGGLCAIAVLGDFDHHKSGHLILHEPKAILELKPGDVVFIPSSGVTHSNSPVICGGIRMSVVQYTAGHNFQFLWPKGSENAKMKTEMGSRRWEESLSLLGTYDNIVEAMAQGQKGGRIMGTNLLQKIKSGLSYLLPTTKN